MNNEQSLNEQQFQPQPYPPMYQQPAVKYAGFWKRFAAILIDKLIISVASLIILLPFIAMIGVSAFITERDVEAVGFFLSMIIVYVIVAMMIVIAEWLYFAIMESQRGATIGKMVLNIVVTDLNGHRITFGRATGRYFGKIISGMILYVGYMMAGWTQHKQALHDIIAGTLVVEKDRVF
jgi:uncharacterized RDD family membrane protein YckC